MLREAAENCDFITGLSKFLEVHVRKRQVVLNRLDLRWNGAGLSSRSDIEVYDEKREVRQRDCSAKTCWQGRAEGLRLALRERGYTEGQNIATEYRYARGKNARYPDLAVELVRLKVDIIVVSGGSGRSRHRKMQPRRFPSL